MFHGSIVALATPFIEDNVDVEGLRNLVEFHIQAGTNAIVAAGTTGESGTLSHEEKLLVIKTIIDQVDARLPVIAGTAENSTKACIQLTKDAMALGADAALIMTPAYIKPTQDGLVQHYQQIAHHAALPIILYNVPGRTACDLLPETVIKLAETSNIIGIKEATGKLERLQQIVSACDGRMDVFSGDDLTAADWMLHGAKGVISVTANVAPRMMAAMCRAGLQKDKETCLGLQEQLMPLHRLMFIESNPIPVKWALYRMGRVQDAMRLPLTSLSQDHRQALEMALEGLN